MMVHFNIAEVKGAVINENSQINFILEYLPKSFLPLRTNAVMNKIEYNLTSLFNELQAFQSMMKSKGREEEINLTSNKFQKLSSSGTRFEPSFSKKKSMKKKKGKGKAPENLKSKKKVADKEKYFHCNEDEH